MNEENITSSITTADSEKSGRLKVDAGKTSCSNRGMNKKKRKILQKIIKIK